VLAQRRITDSAAEKNPIKALELRRNSYTPGDTDLAWTRLTLWRAMLASALDLPPYERVLDAEVSGEADSPSTELLAAWLASGLKIPVKRTKAVRGEGICLVSLDRKSGGVELTRPDGRIGTLVQPGQPERRVALQRRSIRDCLAEELRRLDPDEVYELALKSLGKVVRGRPTAVKPATTRKPAAAKPAAAQAQAPAKTAPAKAVAAAKGAGSKPVATKSKDSKPSASTAKAKDSKPSASKATS
jgi:glucose-6-phosphate dehydrogenase assembly protein OpcA